MVIGQFKYYKQPLGLLDYQPLGIRALFAKRHWGLRSVIVYSPHLSALPHCPTSFLPYYYITISIKSYHYAPKLSIEFLHPALLVPRWISSKASWKLTGTTRNATNRRLYKMLRWRFVKPDLRIPVCRALSPARSRQTARRRKAYKQTHHLAPIW